MARFRYQATDAQGRAVEGEMDAASSDAAVRALNARGWRDIRAERVGGPDTAGTAPARPLRGAEAEAFIGQVSTVAAASAPLVEGLRAAAAESTSRSVRHALEGLASSVERGLSLEKAMEDKQVWFAPHVRGLVIAAVRTGELDVALQDLISHQRQLRRIRWLMISSSAYPLLVLALTLVLVVFMNLVVVPQLRELLVDLELQLPPVTVSMVIASDACVWVYEHALWMPVLILVIAFLLLWVLLSGRGGRHLQWLVMSLPLLGTLSLWVASATFARLLGMLVRRGIPLDEALRMTGQAMRGHVFRKMCLKMADGVAAGSRLSSLVENSILPATLVPFVSQGESTGRLAEGLASAAEMFMLRVEMRVMLLRAVCPPLVFFLVFLVIGFTIIGMILPLFNMLSGLA